VTTDGWKIAFELAKKINWDVVSFPGFKESPGKAPEVDAQVFALSKTSKHQSDAFKVKRRRKSKL
jgi:hypothetical protein